MKKMVVLSVAACIVAGISGLALAADSFVAKDFEGIFKADGQKILVADGTEYTNSYNGPNSTSEAVVGTVAGAVGNQAVHILWNKQDWAGFGFNLPKGVVTQDYKKVSFKIKGSASELNWRLHINDAGDEQMTTTILDDSADWKTIVIPLSDFEHRGDWQPETSDNDEIMEFPLTSVTFESYDNGEYDIWVDQVEFLK